MLIIVQALMEMLINPARGTIILALWSIKEANIFQIRIILSL
jgi:hypothetical protein